MICRKRAQKTPYELHFSISYLKWIHENPDDYVEKMHGTDKDLAAHFTIINHCGMVLYGAEINNIFGEVNKDYYIDSIWNDIKNAMKDITSDSMYLTLNICRVYVK